MGEGALLMVKVLDEQENYLLVTDGKHFTVVERRNGKFYGLRTSAREGVTPDDAGVAELIHRAGSFTEPQARHLLTEVATQWRDLFECVR
jgi:hypothetical protein